MAKKQAHSKVKQEPKVDSEYQPAHHKEHYHKKKKFAKDRYHSQFGNK